MIIRIATEGQYELKGDALNILDELDDAMLDAVAKEDKDSFADALDKVLCHIRSRGVHVPDASLRESDLILPPPDTTLDEARQLFAEYPRDLVT